MFPDTVIDNINELNAHDNELVGILLTRTEGLDQKQLLTHYRDEINFAFKHNIPVVLC